MIHPPFDAEVGKNFAVGLAGLRHPGFADVALRGAAPCSSGRARSGQKTRGIAPSSHPTLHRTRCHLSKRHPSRGGHVRRIGPSLPCCCARQGGARDFAPSTRRERPKFAPPFHRLLPACILVSSRPRKTGEPKDIAGLRLMPLFVGCDKAEQLEHIIDAR